MPHRIVVVRTFSNEIDAHLARERLTAADIPSLLMCDDAGGMHPALQFVHGVRLAVRRSDLGKAQRVLDHLEEEAGLMADEAQEAPEDLDWDEDPEDWA